MYIMYIMYIKCECDDILMQKLHVKSKKRADIGKYVLK